MLLSRTQKWVSNHQFWVAHRSAGGSAPDKFEMRRQRMPGEEPVKRSASVHRLGLGAPATATATATTDQKDGEA